MDNKQMPLEKGFLEAEEVEIEQRKITTGEAINVIGEIFNGREAHIKDLRSRIDKVKAQTAAFKIKREELIATLQAESQDEEASPELVEEFNGIIAEMNELEAQQTAIEAELAKAEEDVSKTEVAWNEGVDASIASLAENATRLEEAFAKSKITKAAWEDLKKSLGFPVNEPMPWKKIIPQQFGFLLEALLKIMLLLEDVDKNVYLPILHRPGFDEIALLNGKRMNIKKHEATGKNSIISGGLTIQEDFENAIGLASNRKKMDIEERKKYFDVLFQELAKRLSSVGAMKWLDACAIELSRQNKYKGTKLNTLVRIPLVKLMEVMGIPVTKTSLDKFRKTINGIMEAFYSISLNYEEAVVGGKKETFHLRILQKRGEVKNSDMYAQFTEDITDYLCHGYPAQFPLSLLKTDERNPNIYALGRYLAFRYSNIINQQQGTADIISVRALLENAPGIPAYEEVMAAGKHLKQRIMQPLKEALDSLEFLTWEYCNAKKAPLTEEQKANFNYETFIDCYVHFTLLNAKDYQPLIEAREEKKAAERAKREARKAAKNKKEGASN